MQINVNIQTINIFGMKTTSQCVVCDLPVHSRWAFIACPWNVSSPNSIRKVICSSFSVCVLRLISSPYQFPGAVGGTCAFVFF